MRHCRTLARDQNGILIFDRLDQAEHKLPVSLQFLCYPDLTLLMESDGILIAREFDTLLKIVPPPDFQIDIIEGDHHGLGWYSSRFGTIMPAPLVVVSGEIRSATSSHR